MNRLRLILPMQEHKEMIMDYKREFLENGDSMDGTAGLKNAETYEEWYSSFCNNLKEETVEDGLVPATTYMAISNDDNSLIGMIDIRHRLNNYLLNFGGHIALENQKDNRDMQLKCYH